MEALWHMTGVVLPTIPLPIHFLRPVPFLFLHNPFATSSCLVHLYPCASSASIWSLFPSWGFSLLLSQILSVEDISGLRKTCPEGRYTSLGGFPFSLRCACTESVWQVHLVHLHPILGRNSALQLSNSGHVCFGVFLCIHTLMPACSWAVGYQSCPLWQTAD